MGRSSASLLAFALGAVLAVGLASCGSGSGADLLPGGTAKEINANLDKVEQLAAENECVGAEDAAQEVSAQVEALGGVDKKLKQALAEGAARLNEVVEGCEEETVEEAVEPAEASEEAEAVGRGDKEKPGKPAQEKPEKEEPAETTAPSPPPAANGEGGGGEGGQEEAPPAEVGGGTTTPSGGVGPGTPVGGE